MLIMSNLKITSLYIYPVKAMKAISLQQAHLTDLSVHGI